MQTADVDSSQGASEPPVRARLIAAEQIRAQYGNMPGAFIGSAVTASFMGAVLYERVPPHAVLPWLAAAYANCGIRFALWKWFNHAKPPSEDIYRWGRYAILSGGIAGIVWGAGGIVLNVPGNLSDQVVVLLVTTGLAFTSTYLSAPFLPAYRAFVYPTFILSAAPFLLAGGTAHLAIGVGTLAFLPLVLRYAGHLSHALRGSIDVRMRNAELVDELRAQKKAAEEANVAKSRFLAVASHDLRQPLHALALFVQALQDSPLPAHERQLVGNVRRSVDAMEELFEALLDISRLDAGAVRARTETIPLADVFERLCFEYAAVAKQKGLSLRAMKTSLYVRSDPTLLARIVRNLVANAIRYTARGSVVIGCRRRGDKVSVEVWDTGPGIPADKRAEVFREFTQLDNPDRDRRKGLGLGLAIVERLTKLLGHDVELRSEVGKGSVFGITVARGHHDDRAILDPVAEIIAGFDLQGTLALLVAGELAGREAMEELLSTWNCEVIAAASGAEMLTKLGGLRRIPDLIIADSRLRGSENGSAVVEMLRNEFNAEVPALLVSGDSGAGLPGAGLPAPAPQAAGLGAIDAPMVAEPRAFGDGLPVLHKPINPARLRTLINNLIHAPPSRARPRRVS
jgi:signal transduction histidine kinase